MNSSYDRILSAISFNDISIISRSLFVRIHSFRHFAASALISSGLDVVTVSGALGHCNSGTALNVYAHLFQTAQARVAQAMDVAFSFLPCEDTTTEYKNIRCKIPITDKPYFQYKRKIRKPR